MAWMNEGDPAVVASYVNNFDMSGIDSAVRFDKLNADGSYAFTEGTFPVGDADQLDWIWEYNAENVVIGSIQAYFGLGPAPSADPAPYAVRVRIQLTPASCYILISYQRNDIDGTKIATAGCLGAAASIVDIYSGLDGGSSTSPNFPNQYIGFAGLGTPSLGAPYQVFPSMQAFRVALGASIGGSYFDCLPGGDCACEILGAGHGGSFPGDP